MPRINNKRRSDGRLQSRVYIGVKNGRRQYKYVYATNSKELEKKVAEQKIQLGKGIDLTAQRDTFGFWAEQWLQFKEMDVSRKKYLAYKARKESLEPIFNFQITKLTTSDFQSLLYNIIQERRYKTYTANELKRVCVQIMRLAIENRVLDYNCAEAVRLPKKIQSATLSVCDESRRALTSEEQQWIRETPHRAQTAAMIMMYAGLRRGELIPLTWEDIDLNEKTISITKSVELIGSGITLKEGGKSASATRTIFIPQILVDYLSGIPHKRFSLVCPSAKGEMMTDTAWNSMWNSYLDDLNLKYGNWKACIETKGLRPSKYAPYKKPMLIPRITAHWLRHTYITLLYLAGVDVLTAKEQSGHADIKTTMEIYTHLDSIHKKHNINKLDEYIKSNDECQMSVNKK